MTTFTLAHLSDPHLPPMPRPTLGELAGKRVIGYVNWTRNRHRVHRSEVIDALIADLKARRPDHVAVTGDLVNIALPAEIMRAAEWLRSVGSTDDVTLVPGNHDAYVAAAAAHVARAWGDYMRGDDADAAHFPFVRRRGPLTLIGLTTAVPTAPFRATGRLGRTQIAALDALLGSLADDGNFRVLLLHHPLQSAPHRRHARLTDSAALRTLLRRHGVDLVLHGHDHRHAVTYVDGPLTRIPVIGVPSASVAAGSHREPAAYNLFAITRGNAGWHVEMTTRGLRHDGITVLRKDVLL
ncbi:metallophosphoesterase family protein [Bradyrhizobium sp. 2TAF24]|uniref:metallophosphoesterase family protein n=1 Tax=Bradyrhizobium sp. 2TAF24 TaxID=3233011 RepID=UPI003F93B3DB